MARDCHKIAKHLNWNKFHIVGISMGGMIAQEAVAHNPSVVESLTLMVTTISGRNIGQMIGGVALIFNMFMGKNRANRLLDALYTKDFLESTHEKSGLTQKGRINKKIIRNNNNNKEE